MIDFFLNLLDRLLIAGEAILKIFAVLAATSALIPFLALAAVAFAGLIVGPALQVILRALGKLPPPAPLQWDEPPGNPRAGTKRKGSCDC